VSRPYSTRFILTSGTGGAIDYVVPQVKRAVIKTILAYNSASASASAAVYVAGVPLWLVTLPGGSGSFQAGLMIVVNAGETIRFLSTAVGFGGSVNGYLLDATG
jgi:hypothetical protein